MGFMHIHNEVFFSHKELALAFAGRMETNRDNQINKQPPKVRHVMCFLS